MPAFGSARSARNTAPHPRFHDFFLQRLLLRLSHAGWFSSYGYPMRVRVLYHDHCFDGAASAAFFSRFYQDAFDPDPEFGFTGGGHPQVGAISFEIGAVEEACRVAAEIRAELEEA